MSYYPSAPCTCDGNDDDRDVYDDGDDDDDVYDDDDVDGDDDENDDYDTIPLQNHLSDDNVTL